MSTIFNRASLPAALVAALAVASCGAEVSDTPALGGNLPVGDQAQALTSVSTEVVPRVARYLPFPELSGLAMDRLGSSYVAGPIFQPAKGVDGVDGTIEVTSLGSSDVAVAKYDPETKLVLWARNYGAGAGESSVPSNQMPRGVAVTADGTIAVIGKYVGGLYSEAIELTHSGTTPTDFLIGLSSADGDGLWGKSFNYGPSGALLAVAANPNLNRIAVCGYTNQVSDVAYGGGQRDLVIAMFDSTGTRIWSRQLGADGEEECNSLVIDDVGNLYAAGRYNGELDLGLGSLANPGSAYRRWLWVAKFDPCGTAVANASFGDGNGQHTPLALALDAHDKLVMAGSFSISLNFEPADPAKELVGVGSTDAFVAKLDPAAGFAAQWAIALGGSRGDQVSGVAVNSLGQVVAVGRFQATTSGAAELTSAGSSDVFLLELSGVDGATQFAAAYGDVNTQGADRVVINDKGICHVNQLAFGGGFAGELAFPEPTGSLTTDGAAAFLTFGTFR
jgi:hypothetical protein